MYKSILLFCFYFFLIIPLSLFSASSCSHTVSIRIIPVDNLQLQGGDVDFTFYSEKNISEQGHAIQTDNSCQLQWSIFSRERKITVETDNPDSDFQLSVRADRIQKGQPVGEVILNHSGAQDFIRGVGRSTGSCDLNYKAVAKLKPAEQLDTHHITYTIVSE